MLEHRKIRGILIEVLKKIKPTPAQRKKLKELSEKTLRISGEEARKFGAKAILAGSLTRDTWLPEKFEFDVFLIFPKNMPEKMFEKLGLDVGKSVIERLKGVYRIEYAQHPYVRGVVNGVGIDIVPCYEVESGEKIKSAVDRTPFHVEYLNKHLPKELSDEVRLLKQFLRACRIYGADAKTEGFSGYICELLIINYGTFIDVLNAVLNWRPGEIIDIEGYWDEKDYRRLRRKFKNQVLIMIDPVDKNRNAAAAVSAHSFYVLKKRAKDFLNKPSTDFFFEKPVEPLTEEELKIYVERRSTEFILLKFKPPEVVPDILWPQLRKTTGRLEGILREYGFKVLRSDCWSDEKELAVIILEMEIGSLPMVEKRVGPLVFNIRDSENFIKKYENLALVGPFIEGNLWCVEIKRKWRNAREKLIDSLRESEEILRAKGIPNHIAKEIAKGFEIVELEKVGELMKKNKEFSMFLRKYFEKEKLDV